MQGGISLPEIWFPNLNIKIHHLSKIAVSIFGFDIYWYAVLIMLGFVIGLLLAVKEAKRIGHDVDIYFEFVNVMFIFGIIGARLYYVIFMWGYYKNNLLHIFNLREGGLAIYGGIIAVFFAGIVFAKIKKINFASFADVCVPCVAMGQAIGRWGNFFNREVFGGYSDSLLAMRYLAEQVPVIPESVAQKMVYVEGAAYIQVQPTFLYESLWNIALFFILMAFSKRKKFNGQIILMYFTGYGIGRFWIEGIRTDQLFLFNTGMPVSQIVSIILTLASVGVLCFLMLKNKTKPAGAGIEESDIEKDENLLKASDTFEGD